MTVDDNLVRQLIQEVGPDIARRLFDTFQTETRARLGRILDAAAANDLERLHEETHTLKGTAGSFGVPSVQAEAKAIEAASSAGDANEAFGRVERLERIVGDSLEALDEFLAEAYGSHVQQ